MAIRQRISGTHPDRKRLHMGNGFLWYEREGGGYDIYRKVPGAPEVAVGAITRYGRTRWQLKFFNVTTVHSSDITAAAVARSVMQSFGVATKGKRR